MEVEARGAKGPKTSNAKVGKLVEETDAEDACPDVSTLSTKSAGQRAKKATATGEPNPAPVERSKKVRPVFMPFRVFVYFFLAIADVRCSAKSPRP